MRNPAAVRAGGRPRRLTRHARFATIVRCAVQAAGGVLAAVDAVMEGKVQNAFCAVRPPGHHAMRNRAMGFCLFNNVAIAARYVQQKHQLTKVLIVDWDVHHGNGTQAIFLDDPSVFYFSVHQYPFYPGTGTAEERGDGQGAGHDAQRALAGRQRRPRSSSRPFEQKLVPAAAKFQPDFVLISAGFDAHEDDPLGGMKVTAEGYAQLTGRSSNRRNALPGRLVSVLEGGYDLEGLASRSRHTSAS